jgi:hypothetical protein
MEWIKQNRFFAGYAGIMIVGVLGLGFWLYNGWSGFRAAKSNYEDIQRSVTALESEKIYPNKENLAEKEARVSRYTAAVDSLQRQAGKLQRDLKAGYSEQQFRNLMNKEKEAIVGLAAEKNMTLPKDFALGFDEYGKGIGIPPHAVSVLEWEFDAIKRFVHIAAESGVDSLDEFSRDKIPQEMPNWKPEGERPERGRRPAGRKPPRGKRPMGRMALAGREKGPMDSAPKVMETYRIMAKVTGSYESLTELLNQIAADEDFFMWLRRVRIENQTKESPQIPNDLPRTIKIPKAGAQANENGDLPEIDVEVDAEVIFGNEKMQAILVVDIVRFKALEIPEKSTPAVSSIPTVPGLQSAVSVNEIP